MIIVKLKGGLGNQLFQYAAGRKLSLLHNTPLKLDPTHLKDAGCCSPYDYQLKHLSINAEIATRDEINTLRIHEWGLILWNFFFRLLTSNNKKLHLRYYREPHFHFDPNFLCASENCYLDGYWQSERYFHDINNIIRSEFRVMYPFEGKNIKISEHIQESESISLHVRRGDYITNPTASNYHGICGHSYYERSINFFIDIFDNINFFVFSDDHDWAKNNIKIPFPTTYISHNGPFPHIDLWLMSLCKHNIIANSSFSWWGAWLNENPHKFVVAPWPWFNNTEVDTKDLLPNSWHKILK